MRYVVALEMGIQELRIFSVVVEFFILSERVVSRFKKRVLES